MKAFKLSLFFSIVLLSLIFSIKKSGVIQEKEPKLASEKHIITDKRAVKVEKATKAKNIENYSDELINELLSYDFRKVTVTGEENRYALYSNSAKEYKVKDVLKMLEINKTDFGYVSVPRMSHSKKAMMAKKGTIQCCLIYYYDPGINNNDKFFTEAIEYGATWEEIEQKRVKGIPDSFLENIVDSVTIWVQCDENAPLKYPVSSGPPYIFRVPEEGRKKD